MSKETSSREATECGGCHLTFAFQEQHWPHCPANPTNLSSIDRKHMESVFTKAELGKIAQSGPLVDKPVTRKRKKVRP